MIREILIKLMNWSGFNRQIILKYQEYEELYFFFREDSLRKEFFFIASINEKQFLKIDDKKYFGNILNILKENEFYHAEMNKNTSFLLLVEEDNNSSFKEAIKSKAIQIEENPYYFKKYVLEYKKVHVEKLYKLLIDDNMGVNQKVEEILLSGEEFRNYKLNTGNFPEYELLMRIMMKIPIISLEIPDNSKVESVTSRVTSELGKDALEKVKALINKIDMMDTNQDIDNFMREVIIDDQR